MGSRPGHGVRRRWARDPGWADSAGQLWAAPKQAPPEGQRTALTRPGAAQGPERGPGTTASAPARPRARCLPSLHSPSALAMPTVATPFKGSMSLDFCWEGSSSMVTSREEGRVGTTQEAGARVCAAPTSGCLIPAGPGPTFRSRPSRRRSLTWPVGRVTQEARLSSWGPQAGRWPDCACCLFLLLPLLMLDTR